jgi:hypothetical protein
MQPVRLLLFLATGRGEDDDPFPVLYAQDPNSPAGDPESAIPAI